MTAYLDKEIIKRMAAGDIDAIGAWLEEHRLSVNCLIPESAKSPTPARTLLMHAIEQIVINHRRLMEIAAWMMSDACYDAKVKCTSGLNVFDYAARAKDARPVMRLIILHPSFTRSCLNNYEDGESSLLKLASGDTGRFDQLLRLCLQRGLLPDFAKPIPNRRDPKTNRPQPVITVLKAKRDEKPINPRREYFARSYDLIATFLVEYKARYGA